MRGPAPSTFPQRDSRRAPLERKRDTNAQAPISSSEPKRFQRSSSYISIPSSSDEDGAPKAKSSSRAKANHGKAEAGADPAAKATADAISEAAAEVITAKVITAKAIAVGAIADAAADPTANAIPDATRDPPRKDTAA
ncbi:5'-3' DNA helicase [Fusarium pseudocircinatum]|uniref:5'-3' DNA helicase n=1 Tax=Fusarium pseudocircinatum TaxID=56676 RepID=A0A8H5NWR6_9HYPO|nr:5'-3' DNA helicase [Fusarium pseudocircinatum]